MKAPYLFLVLLTFLMACDNGSNLEDALVEELVLEEYDYFESSIPFEKTIYSETVNSDQNAALGRILFYDKRLSKNNSISCANCHKQELGFADDKRFSLGLKNYQTTRNSMTLVNNAYQISHFWEGHSGRIEDHILNPISNHIEMGMRDVDELVEKLSEVEDYNNLFEEVYGQGVSEELINQSLSSFVASIISYNSKFDKGKDIDFANFNIAEKEGKDLFFGKAKCNDCHGGNHYTATWRSNTNIGLDMNYTDQGAGGGQFKIPSLRNVGLTSPYMHDGRFETLEEVVNHYVDGIVDHPNLDWALTSPIELNQEEKDQLVDFLHTLTDYEIVSDKKFSNPF